MLDHNLFLATRSNANVSFEFIAAVRCGNSLKLSIRMIFLVYILSFLQFRFRNRFLKTLTIPCSNFVKYLMSDETRNTFNENQHFSDSNKVKFPIFLHFPTLFYRVVNKSDPFLDHFRHKAHPYGRHTPINK